MADHWTVESILSGMLVDSTPSRNERRAVVTASFNLKRSGFRVQGSGFRVQGLGRNLVILVFALDKRGNHLDKREERCCNCILQPAWAKREQLNCFKDLHLKMAQA